MPFSLYRKTRNAINDENVEKVKKMLYLVFFAIKMLATSVKFKKIAFLVLNRINIG